MNIIIKFKYHASICNWFYRKQSRRDIGEKEMNEKRRSGSESMKFLAAKLK